MCGKLKQSTEGISISVIKEWRNDVHQNSRSHKLDCRFDVRLHVTVFVPVFHLLSEFQDHSLWKEMMSDLK